MAHDFWVTALAALLISEAETYLAFWTIVREG